jgi:hypothetical protein
MLDENLVHAIIGRKDLDCGSVELRANLVLTRGHGSLLLALSYFRESASCRVGVEEDFEGFERYFYSQ